MHILWIVHFVLADDRYLPFGKINRFRLTLLPATVFCDVCRQLEMKWPPGISRAHSDKIPTATPTFLGSSFLVVILPI